MSCPVDQAVDQAATLFVRSSIDLRISTIVVLLKRTDCPFERQLCFSKGNFWPLANNLAEPVKRMVWREICLNFWLWKMSTLQYHFRTQNSRHTNKEGLPPCSGLSLHVNFATLILPTASYDVNKGHTSLCPSSWLHNTTSLLLQVHPFSLNKLPSSN